MKHAHNAKRHDDLIGRPANADREVGRPYVIENVVGAPLIDPILLCGTMFGLRMASGHELRRHRLFETSFPVMTPTCQHTPGAPGARDLWRTFPGPAATGGNEP